jgi:hypothetical protein
VRFGASNVLVGRQSRYDALGAAQATGWTHEQIDALMGDHGHEGQPDANTICRHDDAAAVTLLTARVDPAERSLAVGLGTACRAKLEVHRVPVALAAAA